MLDSPPVIDPPFPNPRAPVVVQAFFRGRHCGTSGHRTQLPRPAIAFQLQSPLPLCSVRPDLESAPVKPHQPLLAEIPRLISARHGEYGVTISFIFLPDTAPFRRAES